MNDQAFMGFVFLVIGFVFYFLPTLNALRRKHMSSGAIFVVNLFLGWTCIGWIVALAWAFNSNTRDNLSRERFQV